MRNDIVGKKSYTKDKPTMSELIADVLSGAAGADATKNIAKTLDREFTKLGVDGLLHWQIDSLHVKKSDNRHVITIPFTIRPTAKALAVLDAVGMLVVPYHTETWGDFNGHVRRSLYPLHPERYNRVDSFLGAFITRMLHCLAMLAATNGQTREDAKTLELCGAWLCSVALHKILELDIKAKKAKPFRIESDGITYSPSRLLLEQKKIMYI